MAGSSAFAPADKAQDRTWRFARIGITRFIARRTSQSAIIGHYLKEDRLIKRRWTRADEPPDRLRFSRLLAAAGILSLLASTMVYSEGRR